MANNKFLIVDGKFVINKGAAKFATAKDPTKRLETPTISKSGTTLTISDVDHATSYLIYQNDVQIGEVKASANSKTFDLGSVVYPVQNGTIKVKAHDVSTVWADSAFASITDPYPNEKQEAPEAGSASISGANVNITASATGATNNVFNLEQGSEVIATAVAPVTESSVNLNIAYKDVDNGNYDVTMLAAKEGAAVSDKLTVGTYNRQMQEVILDNVKWTNTRSLIVQYDGGI